jgi:hypothetical protein
MSGVSISLLKEGMPNDISTLIAAIVSLLFAMAVTFWLSFSLLSQGSADEIVKLAFPKDIMYIVAIGLIYTSMFMGVLYSGAYFMFEYPHNTATDKQSVSGYAAVLLKPRLQLGSTREVVERVWGEPKALDPSNGKLQYESVDSTIYLTFDKAWKLNSVQEIRKVGRDARE